MTDGEDRDIELSEGDVLYVPRRRGWGHKWRIDAIEADTAQISVKRGPDETVWAEGSPEKVSDLKDDIRKGRIKVPDGGAV